MRTIIYIALLSLVLQLNCSINDDIVIDNIYTSKYDREFNYELEYDIIIRSIKRHESLCETPIKCPAGYLTIGYGHLIQEGEVFDSISEEDACKLLKDDFNKCIGCARRYGFKGNKELAIANFIFSKGVGSFDRSTLKSLILNNAPREQIENEFLKWCYYKDYKIGKSVFNQKMLNNQKYNIYLFFYGED